MGADSPTARRAGAGGHPCQGLYHRGVGRKPKVAVIAGHPNREARALLRQRKRDEARAKLQRIVKDWPATSAAAKARKLLESDG